MAASRKAASVLAPAGKEALTAASALPRLLLGAGPPVASTVTAPLPLSLRPSCETLAPELGHGALDDTTAQDAAAAAPVNEVKMETMRPLLHEAGSSANGVVCAAYVTRKPAPWMDWSE